MELDFQRIDSRSTKGEYDTRLSRSTPAIDSSIATAASRDRGTDLPHLSCAISSRYSAVSTGSNDHGILNDRSIHALIF